jgi:hypothetical protein
MRFYTLFLFFALSLGSQLRAQTFTLSAVSDLTKVFDDGFRLPAREDTIRVFGLRGEVVSAQCVLAATGDLKNATASIGELRNDATGRRTPPVFISWNFVGSVLLTANAPNQTSTSILRPAPARFPDYLMRETQLDIKAGSYQGIWLTFDIPPSMEAGSFSGNITVRSNQGDRSLPLHLTVYPLSLPSERHLKVTEWYNTNGFERFHGISEKYSDAWYAMLRTYAENMVAHRQNVFQVPVNAIEISRLKNGKLDFDFNHFDRIAGVFWDTKKMDYLETGELARFKDDWFSSEILLKDFKVRDSKTGNMVTIAGTEVVPSLLPALEKHLRDEGWLDRTLFHIKDEPSLHNAAAWREMSSYIHRYAPALKRMDAIETTFLLDDIEIAVPKLDALGSFYDSYEKARQEGVELWFYTVGIYQGSLYPDKTIDLPLIDNRILHWLNYKFDATGFLHWGWNQWTNDPYREIGEHIGDGWHVYPVKEGVVNSLRWEQMRNGIEDYEYFWMLEHKISALKDSLGARFSWIDPKQRSKEIASQVVKGLTQHTNDPSVLYDAKLQIIRELLAFQQSPKVYVQTRPAELSSLTAGSSVEVFGWAEPGTMITVSGKEVPVDKSGFFGERYSVSKDASRIRMEVRNGHGMKEIIRNFFVE